MPLEWAFDDTRTHHAEHHAKVLDVLADRRLRRDHVSRSGGREAILQERAEALRFELAAIEHE